MRDDPCLQEAHAVSVFRGDFNQIPTFGLLPFASPLYLVLRLHQFRLAARKSPIFQTEVNILWSQSRYIATCRLRLGLRLGLRLPLRPALVLPVVLGGLLGYLSLACLGLLWLSLFGLGRGPPFSVAFVAASLARTLLATSRHHEYCNR